MRPDLHARLLAIEMLRIPVHAGRPIRSMSGPAFRSMPAGGVTRVNRRYRVLFFQVEGARRWGKRGYQLHAYLGDRIIAGAILDRVVHNSYQLVLKGKRERLPSRASPCADIKPPALNPRTYPNQKIVDPTQVLTDSPQTALHVARHQPERRPFIAGALAADTRRNELILNDVIGALEQGRSPILLAESNTWLSDLARRQIESESDKFVMMASMNLVNCIAYAEPSPGLKSTLGTD